MEVLRYNLGPLDNNTYVVVDAGEAVIIDPTFDSDTILPEIENRKLRVTAVLNTHAHIDHVVENALFCRRFGVPLWLHRDDLGLLSAMSAQAAWMGIAAPVPWEPSAFLDETVSIPVGGSALRVVHTPGHSPGHVAFLADDFAIVGDVLFAGSIGRTDLPGGNHKQLVESIKTALLPLPDSTIVYPGHGGVTSIGRERASNPFLISEGAAAWSP